MVRPVHAKARDRSDDNSLRKCIRPLASGPLLRPGHDEIHALRSHIIFRAPGTVFCQSLRCADQLYRHHSSILAICQQGTLRRRSDRTVHRERLAHPIVFLSGRGSRTSARAYGSWTLLPRTRRPQVYRIVSSPRDKSARTFH